MRSVSEPEKYNIHVNIYIPVLTLCFCSGLLREGQARLLQKINPGGRENQHCSMLRSVMLQLQQVVSSFKAGFFWTSIVFGLNIKEYRFIINLDCLKTKLEALDITTLKVDTTHCRKFRDTFYLAYLFFWGLFMVLQGLQINCFFQKDV